MPGDDTELVVEPEAPPHPLADAIDGLVHRARDIKLAARQFIPVAQALRRERYKKIAEMIERESPFLDDSDRHKQVHAQKEVQAAVQQLYRLQRSRVPDVIESGLFLGLFSAFDAFTGHFLKGLYSRKPSLFGGLQKTVSFEDILAAKSIEDLKLQVLDEDIEALRRKSYVEQFASLGQRFGLTLTAFDNWPSFVECSQRRNLITHCDGLVTEQYVTVCRAAGVAENQLASVGSNVRLGSKYFFSACELVIEVGIKLGQTLWRKALPEEIPHADKHLMGALYEALDNRIWPRARMIGAFAYGQRELASDLDRKIITINYAQALKRDGDPDVARKLLNDVDWSAAANDFKLARAVLVEDYDEAEKLMKKIGEKGELLKETGYHTWPLFIEFRETDQFARAYQDVFGYPFGAKLKEDATEASRVAFAEASSEEPDADGNAGPNIRESESSTSRVAPSRDQSV